MPARIQKLLILSCLAQGLSGAAYFISKQLLKAL